MPRIKQKAVIGRKTWQDQVDIWRAKIATSNVLTNVLKCANGEIEMSPTRLKANLGCLAKVMPDLSSSEITHTDNAPATHNDIVQRLVSLLGEDRAQAVLGNAILKSDTKEEPENDSKAETVQESRVVN